ncbi:hypothetical protein NHQ30_007481 [Ciborinia camelliae]|nr:hypothetical protein NHQ30_007481 [Ciborinia camelliae]
MRFAIPAFLVMCCISSASSWELSPIPTFKGQRITDEWIKYNPAPVNTGLTVYERTVAATSGYLSIIGGLTAISKTIASSIKALSEDRKCGKIYDSLGGASWVYYATGKDCDTAAGAKIIKRAMKHSLETNGEPCHMECFDLTQYSNERTAFWDGFLLYGPTDGFNSSIYCGPKIPFLSTCGGKNEL